MEKAKKHIETALLNIYPETEIRSFFLLIMEQLTGLNRSQILSNKNNTLSGEQNQQLATIIKRLKNFEPIQYILGETEFYNLSFLVNKNVLIPRPETEELVDWIINDNIKSTATILDIGTGSGCIAISLAKNMPQATINAIDISNEALTVAQKNADNNNVYVGFKRIDILSEKSDSLNSFNIIVSNPPYVCEREKQDMANNVLNNEPHLALFVEDNDPLLFYRHIALFALKHLTPNGKLYFEINQSYGKETLDLLEEIGFINTTLRKDISGKDRMISAIKK